MICEAHPPDAATDELGGRDITPYQTPVDGRPYVITVIKEPSDELDFASGRYTDLSHLPAPPADTVLHYTPPAGGHMMWSRTVPTTRRHLDRGD